MIRIGASFGVALAMTLTCVGNADAQLLRWRRAKPVAVTAKVYSSPVQYQSAFSSVTPTPGLCAGESFATTQDLPAVGSDPVTGVTEPATTPAAAPPPAPEVTAAELKAWDEMVAAKHFDADKLPAYKAATAQERKDIYDAFKKAAPAVPEVTAAELVAWDEMVAAKHFDADKLPAYKAATARERKDIYDAFKKANP